jgi:hypothetical protein
MARGKVASEFRLNQYLYLGDWYYALSTGKQLGDLAWYHWHWGALSPELRMTAEHLGSVKLHYYQNEESVGVAFHLKADVEIPPAPTLVKSTLGEAWTKIGDRKIEEISARTRKTLPIQSTRLNEIILIEQAAKRVRNDYNKTTDSDVDRGKQTVDRPDFLSFSSQPDNPLEPG